MSAAAADEAPVVGNGTRRIEDVLTAEGVFVSTSAGTSMWPMLRDRRDTVVVRALAPGQRLRRFDVALYRRGDAYVLHRVVGVRPGGYDILGDNCLAVERVNEDQVIGVLSEFYRGDAHVRLDAPGYRAYVWVWSALRPMRAVWKRLRARLSRLVQGRAAGGKAAGGRASGGRP